MPRVLTSEEIEACMPDGDGCWMQWLHDFAAAVAEKTLDKQSVGNTDVASAHHVRGGSPLYEALK